MSAPKYCNDCPVKAESSCAALMPTHHINKNCLNAPGPECPFVLLATKDAEIERLREALQEIADGAIYPRSIARQALKGGE